jgi:hypothetical protein
MIILRFNLEESKGKILKITLKEKRARIEGRRLV